VVYQPWLAGNNVFNADLSSIVAAEEEHGLAKSPSRTSVTAQFPNSALPQGAGESGFKDVITPDSDAPRQCDHSIFLPILTMIEGSMIRSALRRSVAPSFTRISPLQCSRNRLTRRAFASVAANENDLPLKGYRVLDMTRVLAGVGAMSPCAIVHADANLVALLHPNTWRSGSGSDKGRTPHQRR
jgi:hypothetical protein